MNNKNKNKEKIPTQRGLRVGSINVSGIVSNPTKRVELNAWMEMHELDIICVQEWYLHRNKQNNKNFEEKNDENEELASLMEYDYNNDNNNENEEDDEKITLPVAQFKNYNVTSNDTKTLIFYKSYMKVITFEHLSDINSDGLDASWIAIDTNRWTLVVGSIYHSPSFECNFSEIHEQMNQIKKELNTTINKKIIFMLNGDYNAKNEIWGSTRTDDRGEYLLDWIGTKRLDFLNDGSYTYYKNDGGKEVLDLMTITAAETNIVNEWRTSKVPTTRKTPAGLTARFSDHKGMIAVLNTDPFIKIKPNQITWNLDEKKISEFKKRLKPLMEEWYLEYLKYKNNPNAVDVLVEYFQLLFVRAARESFGFKKYNNQSVNWVDHEIHKLLKKKKKIVNKISHLTRKLEKQYNGIENATRYMKRQLKKEKRKRNKIQKKLKKNKYKNILESTKKIERLINDPKVNNEKMFYDLIAKITQKKSNTIPPLRDPKNDNIIAQSDMEIANELHRHYTQPLKRNPYNDDHIRFHNYVTDYVNKYGKNRNQNESIVNREYTEQEVLHVINNLNKISAMAFDFIHYQLIIWVKFIIVKYLTLLFNLCFFIHQKCPQVWKYGEFVPIPKPGRVPYYCKNIRPISILPGLGRIIGKLNCNRLLTDCIKRRLLSKRNCAFQCNRSPDNITLDMVEKIKQAIQNGYFIEFNADDLKSAYDSTWIKGLIYRMIEDYKYDGNIIAWYLDFLNNRKTRVKYNGKLTEWRETKPNLPQGSTDSTILFVLYVNNIDLINIENMVYDIGLKDKYNCNEEEMKNQEINNNLIKSFNVVIDNFADDCTMSIEPIMKKTKLSQQMKYNMRLSLQVAINRFYNWTRFYQLIIAKSKCSTITFSRKKKFHAYVYKLDGENLEIIHSHSNCPQICKHNARTQYLFPNENREDANGDSDLENIDNNGNKIEVKEKLDHEIGQIRKTGKYAKQQKQTLIELPLSLRILGVHFDPELYFNQHIEIIKKKVEKKLHCLMRLAYCKYYNFNPFVILKLFDTVIRPKMEYAMCTVSSSVKFEELEKIQKRAIKIALQVKQQTPTKYIMEITNSKTIQEKLEEQQIKMWHKYKRAPEYLLQHHTFNRWKKFIQINDPECMDECGNINIDGAKFNYVSKSPLSRAYNVIRSIYPRNRNVLEEKTPSVIKPPPTYEQIYPNNINVNPQIEKMENYYDFYTDGSCKPNPGPGGASYYSPNFAISSKIYVVDHDTTINYCELYSIRMVIASVLRYIEYCNEMNWKWKIDNINIFTDSQFVCSILHKNGYPEYDYYYKLLQIIFELIHMLNKYNVKINIFKINSHKGIKGNEIADGLAKEAAMIARDCKFNGDKMVKYDMLKNPVAVDIAKDLIRLRIIRKKEQRKEWIRIRNNKFLMNENGYEQFKGDGLMGQMKIDNEYKIKNRNNEMKNELKFLNKNECEIIMKLRTEYINLNNYRNYIGDHETGNCRHCNVQETVSHYLIDCPGFTNRIELDLFINNKNFTILRNKMKKELRKITVFFKQEINFNARNILFPHIWQLKPKRKDENYQQTIEKNLNKRVKILKQIAKFVNETKRFKTNIGI